MEDACGSARCARDQYSVFRVTRECPLERVVDCIWNPFRLVEDEQYAALGVKALNAMWLCGGESDGSPLIPVSLDLDSVGQDLYRKRDFRNPDP